MDGGVIVGYLVAYLTGKAKQLADKAVDGLLERLYAKVASTLRGTPSIRNLEDDPSNDQAQADLSEALSTVTKSNEALSAELQQIVDELNRKGAQQLIVSAPVHGQVFQQVTAQQGSIVGSIGRDINIYQHPDSTYLEALSNAGWLVKLIMAAGIGSCLVGLGISVFSFLSWNPSFGDRNFGNFPPGTILGFALFFAGMMLMIIAKMSLLMRRKR
jgi:hypothetical protein